MTESEKTAAGTETPSAPLPVLRAEESQVRAFLRLVRSTLMLAALTVLALLPCEGLARLVFAPTRFEQKLRAMDQAAPEVQVMVCGSSRAARGVDPTALAWPAYNFGDDGQSLGFTRQVMARHLARLPKVRGLVVVVDEFSFGTPDAAVPAPDYVRHGYAMQHAAQSWLDHLLAGSQVYRYRRELLGRTVGALLGTNPPPSAVSDGDAPLDRSQICLIARSGFIFTPDRAVGLTPGVAAKLAALHNTTYEPSLREENRTHLRAILTEAMRRNVKVVLVRPPLHRIYRSFVDRTLMADVEQDIARVVEGFPPSAVRVRSYVDDPRFGDGEFSDGDHLNNIGARHWAGLLTDELRELIE